MMLTDKDYAEFKKISDEEGITYKSDFEMKQSADNPMGLAEILIKMEQEDRQRKQRLKAEPKGFSMAGEGCSCSLCGSSVYETDGWYDKWGFKCLNCQKAIDKKQIPGSLCGDYDHKKSISDSGLAWKSGLHVQTIRKLIRQGKIKARQIPQGPYIILRKDNPNILDVLEAEKAAQEAKSKK